MSQKDKAVWQFEAIADQNTITVNKKTLKLEESYIQSVLAHEICHVLVNIENGHNHIFLRRLYKAGLKAQQLKLKDLSRYILSDVEYMIKNRDAVYLSDNFVELEVRRFCEKRKKWHPDQIIEMICDKLGVNRNGFFAIVGVRYFVGIIEDIQNGIGMTKDKHMTMSKKELRQFVKSTKNL